MSEPATATPTAIRDYVSPTGKLIVGTLETTPCRCNIDGIGDDGEVSYSGGSEMFYDETKAILRDGKPLFLDEAGEDWTFDQLKPADPAPESFTPVRAQRILTDADSLKLFAGEYDATDEERAWIERERERMPRDGHSGKIVGAFDVLHARASELGNRFFKVGRRYRTHEGWIVTITEETTVPGYECVRGDDVTGDNPNGVWRYNRAGDLGRVTGTKGDVRSLIPEELDQ